jgi:hypothetical protein
MHGTLSTHKEMKNAYKILLGKLEKRGHLDDQSVDGAHDPVKKIFFSEHNNEPSSLIKGREFLNQLRNYQILKDSGPRSYLKA